MGNICSSGAGAEEELPVPEEVVHLTDVNLEGADDVLIDIRRQLLDAIEQRWKGNGLEAVQTLRSVEMSLEYDYPETDPRLEKLKQAIKTDPQLDAIKKDFEAMRSFDRAANSASLKDKRRSRQRVSQLVISDEKLTKEQRDQAIEQMEIKLSTLDDVEDDRAFKLSENADDFLGTKWRSSITIAKTMTDSGRDKMATMDYDLATGSLSDPVPALEQIREGILYLAARFRIFEAVEELSSLKVDVGTVQKLVLHDDGFAFADGLFQFSVSMSNHPQIQKLEKIHERMLAACELSDPAQTQGAGDPNDARWVEISLNASFGSKFQLWMRKLEGMEVDAKAPTTQVILKFEMEDIPIAPSQLLAINRETDLFKASYLQDCKLSEGAVGGSQQLFSSLIHQVVTPMLLPSIRLESHSIREFSKCDVCPLKGVDRGSGVLMVETKIDGSVSDFEGFRMFKPQGVDLRGTVCMYLTPHKGALDKTDVVGFAKLMVPVSDWVPFAMWKAALESLVDKSLTKMKEEIMEKWGQTGYQERIDSKSELYDAVKGIARTAEVQRLQSSK